MSLEDYQYNYATPVQFDLYVNDLQDAWVVTATDEDIEPIIYEPCSGRYWALIDILAEIEEEEITEELMEETYGSQMV